MKQYLGAETILMLENTNDKGHCKKGKYKWDEFWEEARNRRDTSEKEKIYNEYKKISWILC